MNTEDFLKTLMEGEATFAEFKGLDVVSLTLNLLLGGVLALYVRFLFRRFSGTPSDADSVTRVFPLLTLVVTGVIAIVKASLALSLGLVGALSIVRFRAAIKEPEELVYLFLCIALGLALGAEKPDFAIAIAGGATIFILGMALFGRKRKTTSLMLTITAEASQCFGDGQASLLKRVEQIAGTYQLQRIDIEGSLARFRLILPKANVRTTSELILDLRQSLPGCDVSFVNTGTPG